MSCFQSLRQDLIDLATIDSDPDSGAETPYKNEKSVQQSVSPQAEVIEVSDDPDTDEQGSTLQPGSVQCPICGDSMTADYLQRKHLDDCLSGKKRNPTPPVTLKRKRNEISLFFQPRKKAKEVNHEEFYFAQSHKHHHEAKRMPKIDFASVSTPKLKEKLAALKLSVLGTRSQLELRYNQYYLVFNSNLDSSHPVTELELRQKLNQWEKSHLAFNAPVGVNTIFGDALSHKCISDKDFPVKSWQEKYRDEFRALVIAARKSRKIAAESGESEADMKDSYAAKSGSPADLEALERSTSSQALECAISKGLPLDTKTSEIGAKNAGDHAGVNGEETAENPTGNKTQTANANSSQLLVTLHADTSTTTSAGDSTDSNNATTDSTETEIHPAVNPGKSAPLSGTGTPLEIANGKTIPVDQPFDFASSTLFIPLQH